MRCRPLRARQRQQGEQRHAGGVDERTGERVIGRHRHRRQLQVEDQQGQRDRIHAVGQRFEAVLGDQGR
jgi:hypothetical protein